MAEETTYLIFTSDQGLLRFVCPADWKVTFGPLTPGSPGWGGPRGDGLYLRFYEAKERQRAVFANVEWFRPEHLTLERLEVVQDDEERAYERDEDGTERAQRARRRREEFRPVNPPL